MGRNFYFFRHGQTNENAEGAKEGNRTDAYLTADGVKQAERLAGVLRDKKIDVFYSSPLPRAVRTAEIVGEYHPAAPIVYQWRVGAYCRAKQIFRHCHIIAWWRNACVVLGGRDACRIH